MAEYLGWTTELPKTPGFYWFFGQQFKGSKPGLKSVRVHRGGSAVCEGAFMYESELGDIRWFRQMVYVPTQVDMDCLLRYIDVNSSEFMKAQEKIRRRIVEGEPI